MAFTKSYGKVGECLLLDQIRSHLLRKMLIGYLLLLILPCVLFSGIYLYVTQEYFTQERLSLEQSTLSQYCSDIESDMETCESVYLQIQQHSNFLRFLNGDYRTEAKQLELYIKELYTMFTYAKSYSPYIEKVQVYTFRDGLLDMDNYLKNISELGDYELDKATEYGYWRYDAARERLVYRKVLRNITINSALGILEVTCSPELLTGKLSALSGSMERRIYAVLGDTCFVVEGERLLSCSGPEDRERFLLGSLPKLSADVWLEKVTEGTGGLPNTLTLTALLAFVAIGLLSILYFISVSRLSNRIVSFARHLSEAQDSVPGYYQDSGRDEFSQLVSNFNEMIRNNTELVNQIELEQLRQHEMAYKVLQAQIDPHFLYNALESIRMLAELQNETEIADMVFSLSRLMRYVFSTNTGEVTLASELDLVEQYLKIQKMRLGERLSYRISCPPELGLGIRVPQFTIQPLTENAIKYGLGNRSHPVSLRIEAAMEGRLLQITVENNGAGMEEERRIRINRLLQAGKSLSELSSGTGVGLDSINNRMRYLYPKSFSMELRRPPDGAGLLVVLGWDPSEGYEERGKSRTD